MLMNRASLPTNLSSKKRPGDVVEMKLYIGCQEPRTTMPRLGGTRMNSTEHVIDLVNGPDRAYWLDLKVEMTISLGKGGGGKKENLVPGEF